ncbi:PfkB family carbohydrate kinase [Ferruginibacter yonginensis]|uniref:PfkB family carbohydrate kinase n=1 Tax=Ferruginibacter yonginensis TaxID=1310416 RepID=A0ABV8QPD2_9BACT
MTQRSQKNIVCFGELLLRYSPYMNGAFIRDAQMPVYIGGAELNVASALAQWQQPVSYVTALPNHYLANEIVDYVKSNNIKTQHIHYAGERIGAYYLPQGADLKNNAVIYDRNYSSFAQLQPGDIDWHTVLKDAHWFHFSAISPALNATAAAVCLEAVQVASSLGITISVDLNYRAKLWQYGETPVSVMQPLLKYCDVIMGNIWAAEKLAGIALPSNFDATSTDEHIFLQTSQTSAQQLQQQYPTCKIVANTFRFDDGAGIKYYAAYHTGATMAHTQTFKVPHIVDKIGSGDCFMAGLIYGIDQQLPPQQIIDTAATAAILKLQQLGDATSSTLADIKNALPIYE